MSFCTVANCMDGRVQLPVNAYLRDRFNVDYVDSITEAGPVRILSNEWNSELAQLIVEKIRLSIEKHQSVGLAIVSHHDCAGNPTTAAEQFIQLKNSRKLILDEFETFETIGLWVN